MFVKSFMEVAVTYRKSTGDTVLKPLTTTFVDENIVSAKELKACYGDRIAIIPSDMEETVVKETAQLDTPKEDIPDEYVKDMVDFLDDLKNDKIPLKGAVVNKEQVQDVIDFLKGETDDLPEGTELISNEKAKELEENSAKVADLKDIKKDEGTESTPNEKPVDTNISLGDNTKEVTLTKDGVKEEKEVTITKTPVKKETKKSGAKKSSSKKNKN